MALAKVAQRLETVEDLTAAFARRREEWEAAVRAGAREFLGYDNDPLPARVADYRARLALEATTHPNNDMAADSKENDDATADSKEHTADEPVEDEQEATYPTEASADPPAPELRAELGSDACACGTDESRTTQADNETQTTPQALPKASSG